jgi:hypothetical protein
MRFPLVDTDDGGIKSLSEFFTQVEDSGMTVQVPNPMIIMERLRF